MDALRSKLYRISNVLDMASEIDSVLIHGQKLDIADMPCVMRKVETYISIESKFEKMLEKKQFEQVKTHFLRITDFEFYQLGTMTMKKLEESSSGLLKWKYRCDNEGADTVTVKFATPTAINIVEDAMEQVLPEVTRENLPFKLVRSESKVSLKRFAKSPMLIRSSSSLSEGGKKRRKKKGLLVRLAKISSTDIVGLQK